jgi:pSer/pThr/pTyr-binding forkhead associated (FHA) protein
MIKITFKKGIKAGRSENFPPPGIFIGRAADNDIVFDNDSISQYHAEIFLKNKKWYLKDSKGSATASKINGKKIEGSTELNSRDLIYIGREVFQVEFGSEVTTTSAPLPKKEEAPIKIRGPREERKPEDVYRVKDEPEFEEKVQRKKHPKPAKPAKKSNESAQRRVMIRMLNQELSNKRKRLRKVSIFIAIIANIAILLWWLSQKGYIDLSRIDWQSFQFYNG